jgi:hypothetical protein
MIEAAAKPKDRVLYRDANGRDHAGHILAIAVGNEAQIELECGRVVENVEYSDPAVSGLMFLHSWRRLGAGQPAWPEEPGVWTDALAAGIVTALLELEAGRVPLDKDFGRTLLQAFKLGVELVLDFERE